LWDKANEISSNIMWDLSLSSFTKKMDCEQLQQEEIEVLSSIFDDCFVKKDEKSEFHYEIRVKNPQDPDLEFWLKFKFPLKYPVDSSIAFEIEPIPQVNGERKFTFPKELLTDFLLEKANSYLGEAQIYTLITFAQDWLMNWAKVEVQRLKMQETLKIQQENLLEEGKLRAGTPVTKETFEAWNRKFMAEFENSASKSSKLASSKGKTGKQLFESDKSLASSDIRALKVGAHGEVEGEIFEFDPSLYQGGNSDSSSPSEQEDVLSENCC
jgi:hypothetical protein